MSLIPDRGGLERELFPFPIGRSPFRIKGTGYLLHLKYVEEHLPGGRAAMAAAIRDPELRAFFDQTFFAGHWVDLYPLVAVGHTCARLSGMSFERFIRVRSRHQSEGDLTLFRKLILRLASPELLASRIPVLTASYFDFATAEVLDKKPAAITAMMHGVPRDLAPWMSYVADETVRFMLEQKGAQTLRVKDLKTAAVFEREPMREGVEIVGIRSTFAWSVE